MTTRRVPPKPGTKHKVSGDKYVRKNPNRKREVQLKMTHHVLSEVQRLAGLGLTQKQMADSLNISASTFGLLKKRHPEFEDAMMRGRTAGVEQITNALFQNGLNGDTTAQIFSLKNRAPDEWKDRREVNQHVTGSLSIDDFVLGRAGEQMNQKDADGTGSDKAIH